MNGNSIKRWCAFGFTAAFFILVPTYDDLQVLLLADPAFALTMAPIESRPLTCAHLSAIEDGSGVSRCESWSSFKTLSHQTSLIVYAYLVLSRWASPQMGD